MSQNSSPATPVTLRDFDIAESEFIGTDGNLTYQNLSSFPSKAVSQIDVTEPGIIGTFVYNYFTPDENISYASDVLIQNSVTSLADQKFYFIPVKSGDSISPSLPRFVKLDISVPADSGSTIRLPEGKTLSDYLTNIIFEESFASSAASGVIFEETQANTILYNHLSASAVFSGIDLNSTSLTEGGKILDNGINPITIDDRESVLINVLANSGPEGYSYIDGSSKEVKRNTVLANVAAVSFGATVSNVLIEDVLKSARDPFSVYYEEILGSISASRSIQESSIRNGSPNDIVSDLYDVAISPISTRIISAAEINTPRTSSVIGVIVEKQEITPSGEISKLPTIVLDGKTSRSVIDSQVKYGCKYNYTARVVYLVEIESIAVDDAGVLQNQSCLAQVLVAGRGNTFTVACEDLVPPMPPPDINFNIDDTSGELVISWDFPINPTRDIKYFQVMRRASIDTPFELIGMHFFNDAYSPIPFPEKIPNKLQVLQKVPINVFVDKGFDRSKKYIYSIVSADAHGLMSAYSSQIEVSYDGFKQRLVKNIVSRSGAPRVYPNFFLNRDTFIDSMKDSNSTRMRIFFDPEYFDVNDARGNSLQLLKFDLSSPSYKLQLINTDIQTGKLFNISLVNNYVSSETTSALSPAIRSLILTR